MKIRSIKILLLATVLAFLGYVYVQPTTQVQAEEESTVIELNQGVKDQLTTSGDVNYYKFKVTKEGYFQVAFDVVCENPKYGWTISISDAHYNLIYTYKQAKNSILSPSYSFSTGEYIVSVQGGWNYFDYVPVGVEYQIGVNFYETDSWEQEYNDTYETARKLPLDTDCNGTLYNNADQDYYKFSIKDAGHFNVSFDVISLQPEYGWTYYIYDSKLNQIYSQAKIRSSSISPEFGLVNGDYYIRVVAGWNYFDYVPVNQKYTLKVNFTKDNTWEAEFDEDAKVLRIDQPINGSLYTNGDEDYYALAVPKKGTYSFQFDFKAIDVSYGWKLKVLDSNFNQVYSTDRIKQSMVTSNITLGKGEYYVVIVAGWNYYTYVPVNVTYKITPSLIETESNDKSKNANTISVPKLSTKRHEGSIQGNLNQKTDVDYYKFTVLADKTTTISFDANLKKAWKIVIYDSNNKQVTSFIQSKKTTNKKLELAKGTYYIKMEKNGTKYSSATYKLKIIEDSKK